MSVPIEMLVEVLGSLEFAEFVSFLDSVITPNLAYREKWEAAMAAMAQSLRIEMLNDREYSISSLRWVLDRGFTISNFSVPPFWDRTSPRSKHFNISSIFLWACIENDVQLVRACIDMQGENVNTPGPGGDGCTPLYWACQEGHIQTVDILLQNGAADSANTPDSYGRTPLSWACETGRVDIVNLLLQNGSADSVNIRGVNGHPPIYHATRCGSIEIVNLLLQNGATESINTAGYGPHGLTPLYWACEMGRLDLVNVLLSNGAADRVNMFDVTGRSPLYLASLGGHTDIVTALLAAGARDVVNRPDTLNYTPLYRAAENGHHNVVRILLNAGAGASVNISDNHGHTPLFWASKEGNIEMVLALLDAGAAASINIDTHDGQTPLHGACKDGNIDLVNILLIAGAAASVNIPGDFGRVPLYWATHSGDVEMVNLLLSAGAEDSIHTADWNNRTPFREAADGGHTELVNALLAADTGTANSGAPNIGVEKENGSVGAAPATGSILGIGGQALNRTEKSSGTQRTAGELRIQKEIAEFDGGSVAEPEFPNPIDLTNFNVIKFPNPNDFKNFNVIIRPEQGMWCGGNFVFNFVIAADYPHIPPRVTCKTKIYHPNINLEGAISLNILRDEWKPVMGIKQIISGLCFLFSERNAFVDPLNREAAALLRSNKTQFAQVVKRTLQGYSHEGESYEKMI